MVRLGTEGACPVIFVSFPLEQLPADTQAIADFENAAEIDREPTTGGMQVRVREVGARWNAEHPEGGPGRQTRCGEERSERRRHQLRRQIGARAQREATRDLSDPDADLQTRLR